MRKKISVILPVFNEEKYIKDCLVSLAFQTLPPDEIIVVDDGSRDSSKSKIKNAKRELNLHNLKLLTQEHKGLAEARNLGARYAKGDILAFIDADMVCNKNYISELVVPIIEGKEIATFTRSEYVGNLENRWAKFWDKVSFNNKGKRMKKGQGSREKAFRTILASEFNRVDGYDSRGYTDDASVLSKLEKTAKAADKAICYHKNPTSLSEIYTSARWIGRDSKNKNKYKGLLIFSFPWSLVKAVYGSIKNKSLYFFPFKLSFDTGLFVGILQANLGKNHYK